MYLCELSYPVTELKGIGSRTAEDLANLGVRTVADLLLLAPREWEDRKTPVPLSSGYDGAQVNTEADIVAHDYFGPPHKPILKIIVQDETATAALLCFNRNFLARKLRTGMRIRLFGSFQYRYGELQASVFEAEPANAPSQSFGMILPIYPLSGNLNQGVLRKGVRSALSAYGRFVRRELPSSLEQRRDLIPKPQAIARLHFPEEPGEARAARRSLAYEELFYLQLTAARRRARLSAPARKEKQLPQELQERCRSSLPFELTDDQKTVLQEIGADLSSSAPMNRLLQGDVGSGKTLVALLSALPLIEAGYQAAFLAPTELLARQHAENAARLLEPLGVRLAFLTGAVQAAGRAPLLEALEAGEVDLVVGTHALFTEEVRFRALQLVIIDEQHKFGVRQRARMVAKGELPDLLLMTATPIPRTLTLTLFGDLAVSSIRTMPPGRKPVITHLARQSNQEKVYEAVRTELQRGHQAYFVYPRIEEGEDSLQDAERMGRYLAEEVYPEFSVALIHSRVAEEEKSERMAAFNRGELQVLVSTSVVEVGVDVPGATCMVIEHAERFGLAGLHQLRGRVGRGEAQSYAFLVYSDELSEEGKQRLLTMKSTADGFRIAEEDLKLRGPGELAGTRQSGFLRFRFADLTIDTELVEQARRDAFALASEDPGLLKPEHRGLREVMETCPPFSEELFSGG
jgi:ATP-dependent DNA helicase RecG